ncbi:Flagellar hook-length control protein fliK [Vibrio chagasii]|nr:Flagellar hook-length control protein fliK [Vibrio chagasii]
MNKVLKVVAVSALSISSANVFAVSDTFDATLEVKQAITMTKTSDLDFGIITSDNTTDVVVAQGDAGAAAFTLSGESGDTVTVSISDTNLVNGVNTIAAEFDFNNAITLTGGTADLNIGGTARTSSATLVAGTYTANVAVDVTYQ